MSRRSLELVSLGSLEPQGSGPGCRQTHPCQLTQASWGDKDTPRFRGKLKFFLGWVCPG